MDFRSKLEGEEALTDKEGNDLANGVQSDDPDVPNMAHVYQGDTKEMEEQLGCALHFASQGEKAFKEGIKAGAAANAVMKAYRPTSEEIYGSEPNNKMPWTVPLT